MRRKETTSKSVCFDIRVKSWFLAVLIQSLRRKHVLPFMFKDLCGGELQVFVTDVTMIDPRQTRS